MAVFQTWRPPDFEHRDRDRLGEIRRLFAEIYPRAAYGSLAGEIAAYWVDGLARTWDGKPDAIRFRDRAYDLRDPLGRIHQKTVVIAYADSVRERGRPALEVLDRFLRRHFPAVGGLHILPACEMSTGRFNDGGFSQIRRDRIHPPYGTDARFETLMERHFSMTDLVLNHVDIEHPRFQAYLNGDDDAGRCFYVLSESEYRRRQARGDFDSIFRPRPFPLFTIFRRRPQGGFAHRSHGARVSALNRHFSTAGLDPLPPTVIDLLYLFPKVKNDQMLLADDAGLLEGFRQWAADMPGIDPDTLLAESQTQETRSPAWIFRADVQTPQELLDRVLPACGIAAHAAERYAGVLADRDGELFGRPIRALTTFSHVQVDLNTATMEGLRLLSDDFGWYLKMDLNMLRLDAANFAFKKWGTSCFGLPEVHKLIRIMVLSMDCVAPRMVPNLEVNAPLSAVLAQMADRQAPPPMMYDFHLPCMLPVVFNTADARPLTKIFDLIGRYEVPSTSIRFSLDESHDGKSVSGSGGADPLLTYAQRRDLERVVTAGGGHVKFKSTAPRCLPVGEFEKVCREAGLEPAASVGGLWADRAGDAEPLRLKAEIGNRADIAAALGVAPERMESDAALAFLAAKVLNGREPYELCTATRNALIPIDDPLLEVRRYLAFKTLALALMGRHVKATYFNDLLGLPNDAALVRQTGELRNIKRTRSESGPLEAVLADPTQPAYWIARHLNNLIALVDADPAFGPRGQEARPQIDPERPSVACVLGRCGPERTLVVVNTGRETRRFNLSRSQIGPADGPLFLDNLTGRRLDAPVGGGRFSLRLEAYDRLWIKTTRVAVPANRLVAVGSEEEMRIALGDRKPGP